MAVILLSAAAGWWFFGRDRPVEVTTATVTESEVGGGGSTAGAVLNASGYVTARRRATVSSKITGRITEVNFEEGDPVDEGFVLARLDDSLYRSSLRLAESRVTAAKRALDETAARLELARITQRRMERLVAEEVVGEAELDSARVEAEALAARLELEREQAVVAEREAALRRTELADTVIRAPFSGVIISKDAQEGEMVSPVSAGGGFTRTGVGTVVDMASLEIEVDVNESYIARVHDGQRVEAALDAYPDWKIAASVITTVPAADRQKATVLVRIGFDELDPRILPDMGVKVAFLEDEDPSDVAAGPRRVVRVPKPSVRKIGGQDVVFVIEGGTVERRAVRVGRESTGQIAILAGLTPGERIVVETAAELVDGDAVRATD